MDPITAGIGLVQTFISRFIPDKDLANQLVAKANSEEFAGDLALTMGQIQTNIEEAKSASVFVSGWRPFVGWVCGVGIAYNFIVYPMLKYTIVWYIMLHPGVQVPPLPQLDIMELISLLGGMLGLGSLRTVEKIKDKARS